MLIDLIGRRLPQGTTRGNAVLQPVPDRRAWAPMRSRSAISLPGEAGVARRGSVLAPGRYKASTPPRRPRASPLTAARVRNLPIIRDSLRIRKVLGEQNQ